MIENEPVNGAVIPLFGALDETSEKLLDPWQLLARGQGALVSWERLRESSSGQSWGRVLQPGSAFAQHLVTIAEKAGARQVLDAGSTLVRLELPTGQTLSNLVPAVGGGFRGTTRAAGSSKITGQARLHPVSGAATRGLALGPMVGLMALSIGTEMIAQRQQDQMLKAIQRAVEGLEKHEQGKLTAQLTTAQQALQAADAAILDQIIVPQGVGLAPAVNGLHDVKNQALGWLEHWEERVQGLSRGATGVDYDDVKKALDVGLGGPAAFPSHVQVLYRAIVLDSWAQVLTASEAAVLNPGQTLAHLHHVLQERLDENARVIDRMRQLLLTLKETPLTVGVMSWPGTGSEAARLDGTLGRLTHALVDADPPVPILNAANQQVLEAVREVDGTVRVLRPRTEDAA
ncbi:hypothetical protein ACI797_25870 [Geodermatophilus sp. SYSU D00691]